MDKKNSRRTMLKKLAGGTAMAAAATSLSQRLMAAESVPDVSLKGRINHSVCQWCYNKMSLDDLCKAAKEIGLKSVELIQPKDFPTLQKYGLTCAMVMPAAADIVQGFNDPANHEKLFTIYSEAIPLVAKAGMKNIICFSGNRKGISDTEGMENCAKGLAPLIRIAEKYNVVIVMELLNSKVDHADYQCDHTLWGVELCKKLNSENFKLLYDIYHMQIMDGDVIATIKKYNAYIAHYHTGGVPGRNEIDETQELYYPAIMKAIVETGYKGFVGQEFIPKNPDTLASLKKGVQICDV